MVNKVFVSSRFGLYFDIYLESLSLVVLFFICCQVDVAVSLLIKRRKVVEYRNAIMLSI